MSNKLYSNLPLSEVPVHLPFVPPYTSLFLTPLYTTKPEEPVHIESHENL
jgi:hypothetical protein